MGAAGDLWWVVLAAVVLPVNLRASADSGSVGSDGRAGSRGEEQDGGFPGHHTKDAIAAAHPHALLPGGDMDECKHTGTPPRAPVSANPAPSPLPPQSIVQQFLVLLMTSSDESLRFLSFRLDFNEHYRSAFTRTRRCTSILIFTVKQISLHLRAREPRLRASLGATRGRRLSNI